MHVRAGFRPRLDQIHQLGARLVAVDDRRRVLGLRRDVVHRGRDLLRAPVAPDRERLAQGQSAQFGLRHEEAHLHVPRRQQPHHRLPGRDPFAFAIQRVEHQTRDRRGDRLLLQPPFRLFHRRLRRPHLRRLRRGLLRPCRQLRHRQLARQFAHPRRGGLGRRPAALQLRLGDAASRELRLVAPPVRLGPLRFDLRLRQLRGDHIQLLRTLAGLEIPQERFGRGLLFLRLPQSRRLPGRFQREKRRARFDGSALRHRQPVQPAGFRGRHVHVLGLDISLEDVGRLVAATRRGQRDP